MEVLPSLFVFHARQDEVGVAVHVGVQEVVERLQDRRGNVIARKADVFHLIGRSVDGDLHRGAHAGVLIRARRNVRDLEMASDLTEIEIAVRSRDLEAARGAVFTGCFGDGGRIAGIMHRIAIGELQPSLRAVLARGLKLDRDVRIIAAAEGCDCQHQSEEF